MFFGRRVGPCVQPQCCIVDLVCGDGFKCIDVGGCGGEGLT